MLLLGSFQSKATHIIGGEVNYSCLGNNEYELTLTVYRDCFFADPNVFFDDPASMAVFDANGLLVKGLLMPLMNNDTLTPILSDSCLFVPENVCVHTTTYRDTVSLPFKPGGYTVAYQRCCRNQTIVNIVDPLNTGATFTAEITEGALQECNVGARFEDWPPLFICVNEPINYDHSAIDPEGDSLVYRLCTPFSGGDMLNNQPQPPPPPPYDTITWLAPIYSVDNMLGAGIPLAIDPHTGLITGTPSLHGQYVVGICLEEYRNGDLISTTRRDFQYNVGDCGVVAAVINNDSIQCQNLEVEFVNESTNSNDFEWFYGDPSNPGVNSIISNPTYEYPDTGTYLITLIAEPNGECADTATQQIRLKNSTLEVGFTQLVLECVDSVVLSVNNFSTDSDLGIESYLWTLSDGQTSTLENPVFVLVRSQQYTLSLEVESIDGCNESTEVDFFANVLDGSIQDTLELCPGEGVQLNPAAFEGPNITYSWSPTEGLDDPFSVNPFASPNVSTVYTVTIQDSINMCFGNFSLFVDIQEDNAIILEEDELTTCESTTLISASTEEITSFEWSDASDFSNIISSDAELLVDHQGTATYYLRTIDDRGCSFTDEITVNIGELQIEALDGDEMACLNHPFTFTLVNNDPLDVLTIDWQPANLITAGQNGLEATFLADVTGMQIITAEIENQFGCSQLERFEIRIISDESPQSFDITQSGCEANVFTFSADHPNLEFYHWELNDPDNPGLSLTGNSITYTYLTPGTYQVALVPDEDLPCVLDRIEQTIFVPENYFETNYSFDIGACGDEIEINLMDESTAFNDDIISVSWQFDNGETFQGEQINLTFDNTGIFGFQVTLLTALGCEFTYQGQVELAPTNIIDASFLVNSILSCDGSAVEINSNGNPNLDYFWSPADGLSSVNVMNPSVDVSETTVYTVIITDPASNCSITRTVTVEIPEVPLFADFSWDYISCLNELTIQLNNLSDYSAGEILAWNWTLSNGDTYDVENPLIVLEEDEDVNVTLEVITDDGCTASISQEVSVSLVSLNLPDQPLFICRDESTVLNPDGSTAYSYLWTPALGLSSNLAASPTANPSQTTTYTVEVFDPVTGCEVVQEVIVEVASELPQVAFEWAYISCDGPIEIQFENLSTYADGDIVEYEWSFGGQQINSSSEIDPILVLEENQTVLVTLNVIAEDGCSNEYREAITFNMIEFELGAESVVACFGEGTALNPDFDPNLLYEWSPSEGLDNPFAGNPIATLEQTMIYTVTITDPNNGDCEVSDQIEAIVPAANALLDFSVEFNTCNNDGALVQIFDLSTADLEIIEWLWTVNGTDTYTEQNTLIEVANTGELMIGLVITTADGCVYELLTPQVVAIELLNLNTLNSESINICLGEQATLNQGGNPNYTYLWEGVEIGQEALTSPTVSPSESTSYQVTITNVSLDTCEVVTQIEVMVYDQPEFEIMGDEVICEQVGELNIELETGEMVLWSEDMDFSNILGEDATLEIMPSQNGTTYYAQVISEFGCGSEIQSFTVSTAYFEIELEEAATICLGGSIEINVNTLVGEEPTNWNWSPEEAIIENFGSSILVAPTSSTTYSLLASNEDNCIFESLSITVEVIDLGIISSISADRDSITVGESVNLLAQSSDDATYIWSPSIGLDDPNIPDPTASPEETTTYEVEITDGNGCTIIQSITVVVTALQPPPPPPTVTPCEEPFVFIPTAFTPNGDNLNDQLRVEGNEIDEMYLAIYNRYGELVFEATDPSQTWDGTYKGQLLNTDVFGYYLMITCNNGDEFYKQGNISLLK